MQLRILKIDDAPDDAPEHLSIVSAKEWAEGFERHFWPAMWRRVGRFPCSQVWAKLRPPGGQRDDCEALFNDIMEGVDRAKKVFETREKDLRPHPITWLRQRRWEDEDV